MRENISVMISAKRWTRSCECGNADVHGGSVSGPETARYMEKTGRNYGKFTLMSNMVCVLITISGKTKGMESVVSKRKPIS